MSEPLMTTALDDFIYSLTPNSYKTAGVRPATIDASLTPEEFRAVGQALLDAYDVVGGGWMAEKSGLEHQITVLTGTVASLGADLEDARRRIALLDLQREIPPIHVPSIVGDTPPADPEGV